MTTVPHAPEAGNRAAVFAPNWLGDAVMALPALADVRRGLPSSAITVVARPSIAPLYRMVPGVDDVIVLGGRDRRSNDWLESVRAAGFDTAILLPNSFHTALLAWRAAIRERWGYRADCRGPLLTRAVPRPLPMHQAAVYQHLVRELGFANGPVSPELHVSAAMREAGGDLLARSGWDRRAPLVAFAPGAANGRAKQWPPDSFGQAAARLASDGTVPVIIGTPGDRGAGSDLLRSLRARSKAPAIDLVGGTDLPALAGVLVNCRALVTNDSGGMHLAAALGVSVTAMFGPSNEVETRPIGSAGVTILTHSVWCRPCMLRDCPIDHRCMQGIPVDAVVAATSGARPGSVSAP